MVNNFYEQIGIPLNASAALIDEGFASALDYFGSQTVANIGDSKKVEEIAISVKILTQARVLLTNPVTKFLYDTAIKNPHILENFNKTPHSWFGLTENANRQEISAAYEKVKTQLQSPTPETQWIESFEFLIEQAKAVYEEGFKHIYAKAPTEAKTSMNQKQPMIINSRSVGDISYDGDIIIENSASVVGDIQSSGNLEINGSLRGSAVAEGNVTVRGSAQGDLSASGSVIVAGRVNGSITANGDVTVDGSVFGGVSSKNGSISGTGRILGDQSSGKGETIQAGRPGVDMRSRVTTRTSIRSTVSGGINVGGIRSGIVIGGGNTSIVTDGSIINNNIVNATETKITVNGDSLEITGPHSTKDGKVIFGNDRGSVKYNGVEKPADSKGMVSIRDFSTAIAEKLSFGGRGR